MSKNKKIGLIALIGPIAVLLLISVAYAVTNYILSQLPINSSIDVIGSDPRQTTAMVVRVALGFFGMLAIIALIPGMVVGIVYLRKKDDPVTELKYQPRFAGLTDEQINYISGWSWSAFFGSFVFAIGNRLYGWALLSLIPIVSLYVWIKLSISGRRLSWEKGGWGSFEIFRKRQKIVAIVIVILIILGLLLGILGNGADSTV